MRVTHNGTRAEAIVKRSVATDNWNARLQRPLKKDRESQELNKFLDTLSYRVIKIEREIDLHEELTTAIVIKKRIFESESERRTILATINKLNIEIKKTSSVGEISAATAQRHEAHRDHIEEYIKLNYRKEDIPSTNKSRVYSWL